MNALSINTTAITFLDGLFSLNDLHKAAGNEDKHKPSNFMRLEQTKDLIAEIDKCSDVSISNKTIRGATGGTYVCKELVYSYAMWISAKFSLIVIRAFDAIQIAQQKYSVNPADTLTLDQCDQLRGLMLDAQAKLPKELAAKFAISGWSKLRAHFGVPYRNIPQHKFQDALALLSRHVAAQPVFPRMNPGMLPDPRLLCAVNQKWLLTADQNNEPQYTPIPHDACIMTVPQMLKAINEPNSMFVDTKTLFEFVTATVNRLAQRCEYYENKSKVTPVKLAM